MAKNTWQRIKKMRLSRGFTLVELLISISIFAILMGIITLNLSTAQQKASIEATLDTLIADLSQQQIKAMVGDTEGRSQLDDYGIHFDSTAYTLFHGTYSVSETTNFSINLPEIMQVTTTFPSSQIVFQKGSGEVTCFIDTTCTGTTRTITITEINTGQQKVITINRYGVITAIN